MPVTFKRRVVLTLFINESADEKTQYLAESVPAAFSAPLIKTENFIVLNRVSVEKYLVSMGITLADVNDDANAVRLGRMIGADVIVVGKYLTRGDKVSIHAKAIDVQAGRLSVEDNAEIQTNASMFAEITKLAERMSTPMAEKMQPLPEPPPPAELTLERVEVAREAELNDENSGQFVVDRKAGEKHEITMASQKNEPLVPVNSRIFVEGGITFLQPLATTSGQIDYNGKYPFSKLNPGFLGAFTWMSDVPRLRSLRWLESFQYATAISYAFHGSFFPVSSSDGQILLDNEPMRLQIAGVSFSLARDFEIWNYRIIPYLGTQVDYAVFSASKGGSLFSGAVPGMHAGSRIIVYAFSTLEIALNYRLNFHYLNDGNSFLNHSVSMGGGYRL